MKIDYRLIELLILALWGLAYAKSYGAQTASARMQHRVLFVGGLVALLGDIIAEQALGSARTADYPNSLFYVPLTQLPVAVLFLAGAFTWMVYSLSHVAAKHAGKVAGVAVFMLAIALCYPLDWFFRVQADYWRNPLRVPQQWLVFVTLYSSYFVITLVSIGASWLIGFVNERVKAAPATEAPRP